MKENYYCNCDFYAFNGEEYYCTYYGSECKQHHCIHYRRKYETPAQFKQRTGKDYPDNMAVYRAVISSIDAPTEWVVGRYDDLKNCYKAGGCILICANTDYPPPDGWVPEESE
jgi:hypothetical protein